MILAGIDIGTNATRLLIADTTATSHRTLHAARTITRLGQDLDRTGELSYEAQERTLRTLASFVSLIKRFPVQKIMIVGTSALRKAVNAAEFVRKVRERTGLSLTVISGRDEARLTLEGVRRALAGSGGERRDPLRSALVMDIGGGSTELIVTRDGSVLSDASLELGAVYLTERHLASDPPSPEELQALRIDIRAALAVWEQEQTPRAGGPTGDIDLLAGTAGTITTLAAMDQALARYTPDRINGYCLTRDALDAMVQRLARTTIAERRNTPGLERGREDIILAGAVIAQELMDQIGRGSMLVSDWGLREGIVFELYRTCSAQ